MNPQPGDVWPANLGLAAKTRPVVSCRAMTQARPATQSCMSHSRRKTDRAATRFGYQSLGFWIVTPLRTCKASGPCPEPGLSASSVTSLMM